MAKRTNITRIITNEIEKGNIYVTKDGNFVSEEMLTKGLKDDFMKALKAGEIGEDTSLSAYKELTLANMEKASELLTHIENFFSPAVETITTKEVKQ